MDISGYTTLVWYDMPRMIYKRQADGHHLFAVQGCDPEFPDAVPNGQRGRWQAIFYGALVDEEMYQKFRANQITYEAMVAESKHCFSFDFAEESPEFTLLPEGIDPENTTDGLYYRDLTDIKEPPETLSEDTPPPA